jgi:hypothetical protein
VVGGSGVEGGYCHCMVGGSGVEGGRHCYVVGLYGMMMPTAWVEVLFFGHMVWWNASPHSVSGRLELCSRADTGEAYSTRT